MRRVDVLTSAIDLQGDDIGVLEPSTQDFAGRKRSHEDRGLGAQRAGELGVTEDEVVGRDETAAAGEVPSQRSSPIGQKRPARQVGEFQQRIGELLAISGGVRSDHNHPAFGLGQ